jgi:PBSX family phage terminase large subunit
VGKLINLNDCFPEPSSGPRGPLPKQQQFLSSALDPKGPAYILYSGGVGSGKTLVGCISVLSMACQHSGDYLICRLFNPELKLTTYKTFLEICPPELIIEHRVADQIIKIKAADGGVANVIFRGLEEPDKHRSLNLNAAYIDEASQVSEEAFTLLQSRLRGKHYRKILCTTNPNGHSWLYRYWIKKDFGNENVKRQFFSVHAPSTENLHLPDGYVQNMLDSWSEERVKREVMGSWDAFQGQVYTEFERAKHVVKPFAIPKEWTRFVGLDHGYRNPAAAIWCAMDYDGNIYAYREFYQNEWIIEEIVKGRKGIGPGLVDLSRGEKLEGVWVDPSTKANRGKDSDFTTYLEYFPRDWALIPANNEVANGIDRVKQLLKLNERTKQPRMFFFDTCVNLIEQMAQYRYEELTPGQEMAKNVKESPVKKDDHAVDALRYAVMSRPEEPKMADTKAKIREAPTLSGSVQREFHDLKQKGKSKDVWSDYDYEKDTSWIDPF